MFHRCLRAKADLARHFVRFKWLLTFSIVPEPDWESSSGTEAVPTSHGVAAGGDDVWKVSYWILQLALEQNRDLHA